MTGLPPDRRADLQWGIRGALIDYMLRDPGFAVETEGGASFSPDEGVRMSGRVGADGVLRLDGRVVLRAHAGALTVPLVEVEVTETALSILDPAEEAEGASAGAARPRLALVRLEAAESADESVVYTSRLAGEADALFMYNYIPDTPFDPVRISLSGE